MFLPCGISVRARASEGQVPGPALQAGSSRITQLFAAGIYKLPCGTQTCLLPRT